jgi:hypothetical protein
MCFTDKSITQMCLHLWSLSSVNIATIGPVAWKFKALWNFKIQNLCISDIRERNNNRVCDRLLQLVTQCWTKWFPERIVVWRDFISRRIRLNRTPERFAAIVFAWATFDWIIPGLKFIIINIIIVVHHKQSCSKKEKSEEKAQKVEISLSVWLL